MTSVFPVVMIAVVAFRSRSADKDLPRRVDRGYPSSPAKTMLCPAVAELADALASEASLVNTRCGFESRRPDIFPEDKKKAVAKGDGRAELAFQVLLTHHIIR